MLRCCGLRPTVFVEGVRLLQRTAHRLELLPRRVLTAAGTKPALFPPLALLAVEQLFELELESGHLSGGLEHLLLLGVVVQRIVLELTPQAIQDAPLRHDLARHVHLLGEQRDDRGGGRCDLGREVLVGLSAVAAVGAHQIR